MRIAMSLAALAVLVLAAPVRAQVCGNGVREPPEQCDDGNTANLDGCSATCTFEQVQRINQLTMQFNASASCPANALGGAFAGAIQPTLQSGITNSIANGSTSALIYFAALADLSGTSDPAITLGLLNGQPFSTLGGYNGASDLDWWYLPDPLEIDSSRLPTDQLSGSIASSILTAGPGTFGLKTSLAGTPTTLQFSSLAVQLAIGASSTPMSYAGSTTSGHLPSENLDPALTSFGTAGGSATDVLCGNVSAASLAATPLSSNITTNCSAYSAANSTLDLLVGGCTIAGFIPAVYPTQPDRSDPAMPAAGAGAPYTLSAATASKIVDTCKDKNGVTVTLATCLDAAAYSSFFKLATDRVMFKYDVIFRDGFE